MELLLAVISALIMCLIWAVWKLYNQRLDEEERLYRHLDNLRPQSFNPDSLYFYEAPPLWQFDILSDDLGGTTILGHGWRYEDWLITCKHVISAAKERSGPSRKVYMRHKSLDKSGKVRMSVKDVTECEWREFAADVSVTRYIQSEFPFMQSAKVKAISQPVTCKIATSFPQDNASLGTIERFKFGVLQYKGSTRGGFSGATYVVDGRVVGMHLAGGVENLCYAATYLANRVRREEDSADEILKRMLGNEEEVEYDEVTPDEVQVHYRGLYYMYDKDDFFRLLNNRKKVIKASHDFSFQELESGSERVTAHASTQTVRGLGVVSDGTQTAPKSHNASTQTRAKIVLERGESIPMEMNKAPVLRRTPGGVLMIHEAYDRPQLLPLDIEEQIDVQLEAAEAFTSSDEEDFEPMEARPESGVGSKNCEIPARTQLEILAGSISALTVHMQQLAASMSQVPNMGDWNAISANIAGLREEQRQLQSRFDHTFRDMERRVIPPPIERRLYNLESSIPSSTRLVLTSEEQPRKSEMRKDGVESLTPSIKPQERVLASLEDIKQSVKRLGGTASPVQMSQIVNNCEQLSKPNSDNSGTKLKSRRKRRSGKSSAIGSQRLENPTT